MNARLSLLAIGMSILMASAMSAEVMVAPALPTNVKPDFFERIQTSRDLGRAIQQRGKRMTMQSGTYRMRVPCDNSRPDAFADITLTLGETSLVQFFSGGAVFFDHIPAELEAASKRKSQ